ncbi:MAG: hypothetical protein NTZ07_02605 [Candidatus Woesebacteria bacterium]|nr:hypothetical protein [Candidatus Woesebacteria bacterium]
MDPTQNQKPVGASVSDPNAGVAQTPIAEPVVSTPTPAMPSEPVVPASEPQVPATPEPVAPVAPVTPAEGTGDAGAGMPPTTPPAV